jgi:hypothetical protein
MEAVMRRWRTGGLFSLVIALAAASPALAQSFEGVWRGTGRQTPAADHTVWPVIMTLNADGGRIDYPTLHCGGPIVLVARRGDQATYHETITYGRAACVSDETITVRLYNRGEANEMMVWTSTGVSGGVRYSAVATLTRMRR